MPASFMALSADYADYADYKDSFKPVTLGTVLFPTYYRSNLVIGICGIGVICGFLLPYSFQTTIAANRLALVARDSFGFGKHAQEILAQNLANILLAIAALQQFISDVRQHRDVTSAFGKVVRAVEICADTDMIDACNFHNMIDVIDELGK